MRTVSVKWAIPVAVAAALLAGCGSKDGGTAGAPAPAATSASPTAVALADKAGDDILAASRDAIKEAKSFRLKGSFAEDGKTITMDLKLNGEAVQGTLSMGKGQGTVEILAVDGQQFIRPDKKFWDVNAGADVGATIAQLMGKKWAKLSTKDEDLAALFAPVSALDELLKPDGGSVVKGETKKIGGVDAIALMDSAVAEEKLWIATTGKPYPVLLESPSDGTMSFSEFGKDPGIKAPAASSVIDFDKLTGN
ncbi:hypothetical protein SAMN05421812_1174 [Asanoa hainanensis]|uniref:Lipoprotein LprG n=1 Tax=Asanoa hainanensis TaxID=560556 RepID=A0A239PBC5_9ACTN|nr:hypothetical protein [Asanoa hainanensis]SNT64360.1 hypothetical protein SAMN05421812_1174 [Asanoa hainanensis]